MLSSAIVPTLLLCTLLYVTSQQAQVAANVDYTISQAIVFWIEFAVLVFLLLLSAIWLIRSCTAMRSRASLEPLSHSTLCLVLVQMSVCKARHQARSERGTAVQVHGVPLQRSFL